MFSLVETSEPDICTVKKNKLNTMKTVQKITKTALSTLNSFVRCNCVCTRCRNFQPFGQTVVTIFSKYNRINVQVTNQDSD
jgi:hypothetical protein